MPGWVGGDERLVDGIRSCLSGAFLPCPLLLGELQAANKYFRPWKDIGIIRVQHLRVMARVPPLQGDVHHLRTEQHE